MRSAWLPTDAKRLFEGIPAPWWVAGGWALDLAYGSQTRAHEDLDIAILRKDVGIFGAALAGWEVRVGLGASVLGERWNGSATPDAPALWCREREDAPWAFELLLSDTDRGDWTFRHDPAIRMPLARIGRRTLEGIPYLAPELVLLHKARRVAARDTADFERTLPLLDAHARAWLAEAFARVAPDHAWRAVLLAFDG